MNPQTSPENGPLPLVNPNGYMRAEVFRFRAPVPKILCGDYLQRILALERSISQNGLRSALIVSQIPESLKRQGTSQKERQGKLIVIDGRNRLCALRRLHYKGQLPEHLRTIPYIYARTGEALRPRRPAVITARALQSAQIKAA